MSTTAPLGLIPLDQADRESCGGKAAGLRRLAERGMPVPAGICLPVRFYRDALPAVLPREERSCPPLLQTLAGWRPDGALNAALLEAAETLGWPLAVRSSATCEDLPGAAAPGLFHTELGVGGVEQLIAAITRCWASLWSVPAWIVLRRNGRWPGGEAMALVLQRQIAARRSGLALSRDPRDPERLRVEAVEGRGEALVEGAADPLSFTLSRTGDLPPALEEHQELRAAVLEAEEIWGETVEVEWAVDDSGLWLLQARAAAPPRTPEVDELSWETAGDWRWDREHNPEPLSPAHESLVERLDPDRTSVAVINGFLYDAVGPPGQAAAGSLETLWQTLRADVLADLEELERRPVSLTRALAFFEQLFQRYFGELSPARRAARRALARFLASRGHPPELAAILAEGPENATLARTGELFRLAAVAASAPALLAWVRAEQLVSPCPSPELAASLREHLARYGALTPVWDVATPTLAERPERLLGQLRRLAQGGALQRLEAARRAQIERGRALEHDVRRRLTADEQSTLERLLEDARLARRIEEEDDLLFSRALAVVRSSLLWIGESWAERGWLERRDEVFLLTLDEVEEEQPGTAEQRAARQAEWERRRRLVPPNVIRDGEPGYPSLATSPVLRGLGVGGTARGPVRLVTRLEELVEPERSLRGAVVVCATLLPALAVVLPEVAALVTDHGGLLSHAASLARELGVTAVVGTGAATRTLREGEQVWVDGGRGLVVRDDG
jgi:pyruvate,water dikinase